MRAGEHVTPQVRLVRPIGSGGMGAVWVADHLALKTQVAVKFILAGRENDGEARERFSREAEAAAQVKSPHVAQIFDHGVVDDGIPFIVMELLEGEDLARYVNAHGRLGLREISSIIMQICRALARAHAKGLIHRDVKPANVFLCDVGTDERFVKLLDFGVAKVLGDTSSTKSGAVTGTPVYMSPEQLLGAKDLDHRADLWSVAVVASELMTGRRPFLEETAAAIALRVHTRGMPAGSEGMIELSDRAAGAIDDWFAKAWALQPSDRFSSALELSETFQALVQTLYEAQGVVDTSRPFLIPVDRLSVPGERSELTVREKAISDVTLQSGRLELPRPPISIKFVPPSAAPHTETPISRGVGDSGAPVVPSESPPRARIFGVLALALAGLLVLVFVLRRPSDTHNPNPTTPASSAPLQVKSSEPVASVVVAPPSVSAAPSTIGSATAQSSVSATSAKKVVVVPAKSATSAAPSAKKLEEIE